MIEIESCVHVSEEPPCVDRQHFLIQDSTPWSCTPDSVIPLYNHLFDIFTGAPRGDSINAPSWFIFQGRGIATYSEANIAVICHSGQYGRNLTLRHRNLPHPIVRGSLKVIDQGLKCLALDPDTNNQLIVGPRR
ncbi:hypothetical protein PGT21_032459 [Puccinia graminis f. sp. tritici]|uniref:Uncharacterized protein n=1 Tax=Puccinia graminis f. sp. tritici TaxID=56615 RepID=A0A5B0PZE1_PUCGR|nr:hypothetical protein PGT21_032459 [Puccinia graminis f. sp. tritici]KAA1109328.1 hypothetical protein PGTUg99_028967 [Puccinia graminis f. sp. tritici]